MTGPSESLVGMADLVEEGTQLIDPYTGDNLVLNLSVLDSFLEAVEEVFATSSTPDTAKEKQSNPKKRKMGTEYRQVMK